MNPKTRGSCQSWWHGSAAGFERAPGPIGNCPATDAGKTSTELAWSHGLLVGDARFGRPASTGDHDARKTCRWGHSACNCCCDVLGRKRIRGNPDHDGQHLAGRAGHRGTGQAAPRTHRGDQDQSEQDSESRGHLDGRISLDWTGLSVHLHREDHIGRGHAGCGDPELRPSGTSWPGGSAWPARTARPSRAQGELEDNHGNYLCPGRFWPFCWP